MQHLTVDSPLSVHFRPVPPSLLIRLLKLRTSLSEFLTHRGWDGECEEHLFDSWDLLDRQSFVVGQCWAVRSKALQSNGLVTSGLLSGEFCQYAAAV